MELYDEDPFDPPIPQGFPLDDLIPCSEDARTPGEPLGAPPPDGKFWYLGVALTADAFTQYVADYNFGSILPSFVVIHNTYKPSASWAPADDNGSWDAREQGLTTEQIKTKRLGQLKGVENFYQNTNGWDRGPHLFIDNRWIYLFTPMSEVGIHAKEGNSRMIGGKLKYSIGIETVGHFVNGRRWSPAQAQLVAHAVVVLQRRLRTFELVEKPFDGGVSFHRTYNKPSCPGISLDSTYALNVLRAYAASGVTTIAPVQPNRPPAVPPAPAPTGIRGPDKIYRCGAGFIELYAKLGGVASLGYPLSEEYGDTDSAGEWVSYMRLERCWLKYKPSEGRASLAPLNEVIAKAGTPAGEYRIF